MVHLQYEWGGGGADRHPTEGGDRLADGREVVEQIAPAARLTELLDRADALGGGLQDGVEVIGAGLGGEGADPEELSLGLSMCKYKPAVSEPAYHEGPLHHGGRQGHLPSHLLTQLQEHPETKGGAGVGGVEEVPKWALEDIVKSGDNEAKTRPSRSL